MVIPYLISYLKYVAEEYHLAYQYFNIAIDKCNKIYLNTWPNKKYLVAETYLPTLDMFVIFNAILDAYPNFIGLQICLEYKLAFGFKKLFSLESS